MIFYVIIIESSWSNKGCIPRLTRGYKQIGNDLALRRNDYTSQSWYCCNSVNERDLNLLNSDANPGLLTLSSSGDGVPSYRLFRGAVWW